MDRIYPQVWMALSKEFRGHLMKVFSITPSGVSEVRDQEVVSDGFTTQDLQKITLDKMCEYIGSRETFTRAWEITLMRCKSELYPPVGEIKLAEPVVVEKIQETIRPAVEEKIEQMVKEAPIAFSPEEPKPRFCEHCDSKGGRHLRTCVYFK